MIKVAFLTSSFYNRDLRRQLPSGQNYFEDAQFFVSPEEADIIFVHNKLEAVNPIHLNRQIPKVFISTDSPSMVNFFSFYSAPFLSQFDYVMAHSREFPHSKLILGQTGIPWFSDFISERELFRRPLPLSFEDLKTHYPQKTKLASVIASLETAQIGWEGHRARFEFVMKLKDALGDQVDVFGRGTNGFADKRDVLDEYRYHIAIENAVCENYWTEKLSTPYLTLTFPIYHGCPNIADYFHHDAIRTINIYEPDKAIKTIKDIIASDLAEKNRDALLEARRQVLYDYNIFAVMARTAKDILAQNRPVLEIKELRSEEHFWPLYQKVKYKLWCILHEKCPRLLKSYHLLKYKIFLRKPLPTATETE